MCACGSITVFYIHLYHNVLVVQTESKRSVTSLRDVIMAVINDESTVSNDTDEQVGTLMQFRQRLDHLSYGTIKNPRSGII